MITLDPTVQVSVIAGLFGLLTLVIQHRLARGHKRDLAEVKEHVANNHDTNLRDDLDFIRDVVLDVRADLTWMRRDHIDLAKRVKILEGVA